MKKVFQSNSEIAHLWAHAVQDEARKAGSGNFYFHGAVIYSYGSHFPIAKRLESGVYLFTTQTYSPTTARHIWAVKSAIPKTALVLHCDSVDLPRKAFSLGSWKAFHLRNLDSMGREALDCLAKASNARSLKASHISRAQGEVENAKAYIEYFKLKTLARKSKPLQEGYKAFSGGMDSLLANYKEKRKEELAREKAREKIRLEKEREERAEFIAQIPGFISQWRKGEIRFMPQGVSRFQPVTFLRLSGDCVETSKGANVPILQALKLFRACKAFRAGYDLPLPERVGHYGPVQIHNNGDATIGCHSLIFGEMEGLFVKASGLGILEKYKEA